MLREVSFERLKDNLRNYLTRFNNTTSLKDKSQIKNEVFNNINLATKYEEINLKKSFFEPTSYSQMVNEELLLTSIVSESFLTLDYADSIDSSRELIYENKLEEVKDRIRRIKAKMGMLVSSEGIYRKVQVESFQDSSRIKASTLNIDYEHGLVTLPISNKSYLQVQKYIIKRDSEGVIGTPSGRNNTITVLAKNNKDSFSFYKNKESKLVVEGEFRGGLQVVNGLVVKVSEESKVGSVKLESIRLDDSDELLDYRTEIKESYRLIIAPRLAGKFKLTFVQDAAYYFNEEPIFQIDLKEIYFESHKYSNQGKLDFYSFQCNPEWMYGISTKVQARMLKVCDLEHTTNGRKHIGNFSEEYFSEGLNSVESSLEIKRKQIKILSEREEEIFSFKRESVESFVYGSTRTLRSSVEDLSMTKVYLNLEAPFRSLVSNNQVISFQLSSVETDEQEVRILSSDSREELYRESSSENEGASLTILESSFSGRANYSRIPRNMNFIERVSDFLLEVNSRNTILSKSYISIYDGEKVKQVDFKLGRIGAKEYLVFNKSDFDVFYESKIATSGMILSGAISNSIVCEGVELVEYVNGSLEFKNQETQSVNIPASEEEVIAIEIANLSSNAELYQYGTLISQVEVLNFVDVEAMLNGEVKYETSSGILYYKTKDDSLSEGYSVRWTLESDQSETRMSFDSKKETLYFSENTDLTDRVVKYKRVKERIKLSLGELCNFVSSEEGYIEVSINPNIANMLTRRELVQVEFEEVGVDISDMLNYATPVIEKVEHFIS